MILDSREFIIKIDNHEYDDMTEEEMEEMEEKIEDALDKIQGALKNLIEEISPKLSLEKR